MKKLFLIIILACLPLVALAKWGQKEVTKWEGFIPYLLGVSKPTSYLILLGNDTESRANGGFYGSYAKLTLSSPTCTMYHVPCTIDPKISFHDIYVPNGQNLNQYVAPPEPIQQAFGHGTWDLANADWDPDFPTAATSIRWFFDKAGEINPDILGIINLTTIKKVLDVVGSFEVEQYHATLTPDNFYLFLQGKVETNFFPGSTQKADTLHNVGTAFLKKLKTLSLLKKYQIAKILYRDFQNQNLVINSKNPDFQKFLLDNKLAGQYQVPNTSDFFGLVEMNLGANKANPYVTRHTTHTISPLSSKGGQGGFDSIHHQITITFQNSSPEANPNPPLHYGGNYLAYLRLYLPQSATNIQITHTEIALAPRSFGEVGTSSAGINPQILTSQVPKLLPSTINDLRSMISYGFWHLTPAGSQSTVQLSYDLPVPNPKNYSLTLLKQNGFVSSPQTITLFDTIYTTNLNSTYVFKP